MCACVFFFKQKTAYEMRISDWSSDVCSSDLCEAEGLVYRGTRVIVRRSYRGGCELSSNTNADFPRLRVPRYTAFGGTRHERSWGSPGSVRSCLDTPRYARHRSGARPVGKDCVSPCRSRWSPYNYKKKKN